MRTPTPLSDQLKWWRNAIETGVHSRTEEPECGFYKVRKERRSREWLPARIWLQQAVDWETAELTEPESKVLEMGGMTWTDQEKVAELSLWLRPVTVAEWQWLTARQALRNGNLTIASIDD